MITREALRDGALQQLIAHRADLKALTREELAASREAILARHKPEEDVWLFAYGSLIWNPAFHFAERRIARLIGWHRRFCLWTNLGRGSPECPGLVLGLERGGSCGGVLYRISAGEAAGELELVWRREMVTGAYRPTWVNASAAGDRLRAIAFVIDRGHERYAGRLAEEIVVNAVATAAGALGTCRDYLSDTALHLRELGIADPHLERLCTAVEARPAPPPPLEAEA